MKIKLNLCITQDLIMELLSFGDNMKVIQPKRLADELKEAHKKAYKQY
jgi:predicted DNA-binding transcriptional regulator YafY